MNAPIITVDLMENLQDQANQVAEILQALANGRRLFVLCQLQGLGEANVTTLAASARLSQSALSQHLAKLRAEGLVTFRREGQTLWYRIADPRVGELLATLHRLFCTTTVVSNPE